MRQEYATALAKLSFYRKTPARQRRDAPVDRGTLRAILRQANLTGDELTQALVAAIAQWRRISLLWGDPGRLLTFG
ncbi:MAG: hypothetical protein ACREV4_03930 [Gammaproteobacteria bacterium]